MRCKECASLKSTTLYKVNPGRLILAQSVGLAVCTLGAGILQILPFIVLIVSPFYGRYVAEMILKITGRKRGGAVLTVGLISILGGALISFGYEFTGAVAEAQYAASQTGASFSMLETFDMFLIQHAWHLLGIAIATGFCYSNLRE